MNFEYSAAIFLLLSAVSYTLHRLELQKQFGGVVVAMLFLSLALVYVEYFATTYHDYAYDVDGHMGYVRYIANSGTLPPPYGWHDQQPPLYYIIAAMFYKVGEWMHLADPFSAARFFSLMLYTWFLILTLITLRYYLSGWYYIMASSLVLFCPEGVMFAGRISNDIGMLLSHAMTFYLLTLWHCGKYKQQRFLLYACFSALIGMLIKSNGVIGLGAVAIMVAHALYHKKISYRFPFNAGLIATAIFSLGMNFGRIAYFRWMKGADIKWFINLDISQLTPYQHVGNVPFLYLYMDVASFLRAPYFYNVPSGGHYFWNAFLKSLLFGEWMWVAGPVPAQIVSAALLVILAYAVAYLLLKARPTLTEFCLPALVFMFCMIGALIVARIEVPWSSQCNARYIYGIIAIFALYFVKSIEWHYQSGRTALVTLGVGTVIAFNLTSIFMIVSEFYGRL